MSPRRGLPRRSTAAGITLVVVLVAGIVIAMTVLRERDGRDERGVAGEPSAPAVVPRLPDTTVPGPGVPTTVPAGPPGPANLVRDPGFEAGLGGWRAAGGATLTRESGGRDGAWAARVTPGPSAAGAALTLAQVTRTGQGKVYHAAGWVRAAGPGAVLTIALYERSGGRRARANVLGVRLDDTGWHQFGTLHRAALPGAVLSFEIAARELPAGGWFEVDQVLVHEL